jgi:elongation factor P--(R)-beta-lysine ligase
MWNRIENLKQRSRLVQSIRVYFHERAYTEVQAPCVVDVPSIEPHIDPLRVLDGGGKIRYLHTSPEYALKKLLAKGLSDCFSLGPCFRDETASDHHATEFTMLEWYSTNRSLFDLMDETESLIRSVWQTLGSPEVVREGASLDLRDAFERRSVSSLFQSILGFCPIELSRFDLLEAKARETALRFSPNCNDYDSLFHQLFLNYIEPNIGKTRPTFVWGWPPSQAALARLSTENPIVALRFELYAGNLELANAFDELTDPKEQRRRFEQEQAERRQMNKTVFELDEALLSGLNMMPATAGIALGVDRLAMLLLNIDQISEVKP